MAALSEVAELCLRRLSLADAAVRADGLLVVESQRSYLRRDQVSFRDWEESTGLRFSRMVAEMEDYSIRRLEEKAVCAHRCGWRVTIPSEEERVGWARSWATIATGWEDELGVQFSDFDSYHSVQGLREVRHAVVHGLGTLTAQQRQKGKGSLIRECGIAVDGDTVVLDESAIEKCRHTLGRFIVWLDMSHLERFAAASRGEPLTQ